MVTLSMELVSSGHLVGVSDYSILRSTPLSGAADTLKVTHALALGAGRPLPGATGSDGRASGSVPAAVVVERCGFGWPRALG